MYDVVDLNMTEQTWTIREMCKDFDVTPRTLRFYETKELLSPRRVGQKRLFTRRDRGRLTLILRGKRFGFSLEEIRQLLDLYYLGDQQTTQLQQTLAVAEERLVEMQRQRDASTTPSAISSRRCSRPATCWTTAPRAPPPTAERRAPDGPFSGGKMPTYTPPTRDMQFVLHDVLTSDRRHSRLRRAGPQTPLRS